MSVQFGWLMMDYIILSFIALIDRNCMHKIDRIFEVEDFQLRVGAEASRNF